MSLTCLALWYTEASIDLSRLFGSQFVDTNGAKIDNRHLGWGFLAAFSFLGIRAYLVLNAEKNNAATEPKKIESRFEEVNKYAEAAENLRNSINISFAQIADIRSAVNEIKGLTPPAISEIQNLQRIVSMLNTLAQYEYQYRESENLTQLVGQMRDVHSNLCRAERNLKNECMLYYKIGESGEMPPMHHFETTESLDWGKHIYNEIPISSLKISNQYDLFTKRVRELECGVEFLEKRSLEKAGQFGAHLKKLEGQLEDLSNAPDLKIPKEVLDSVKAAQKGYQLLDWDRHVANAAAYIALCIGLWASTSMSFPSLPFTLW